MSASENWRFETKQIHSGAQPDPVTKARATPAPNRSGAAPTILFGRIICRRTSSTSPGASPQPRTTGASGSGRVFKASPFKVVAPAPESGASRLWNQS